MHTVGLESDMWSLGMLFYQLLCGRLPFADSFSARKSPMDVMMAILSEDVKFEGPRWGCISKGAQSLIMRMLDRDYNTRVSASAWSCQVSLQPSLALLAAILQILCNNLYG